MLDVVGIGRALERACEVVSDGHLVALGGGEQRRDGDPVHRTGRAVEEEEGIRHRLARKLVVHTVLG